ncbi:MAG TPA: DUF3352 domain-containing protein [Capillimicrobium sp.]|nr:DUF3352 domain-containing protein [Capillimicrobium sp.]
MLTSALARPARRAALAASAGALALGLAACGGGGDSEDASPASAVPATAPIYAEAVLRPEGDLKKNVDEVLQKVTQKDDPGAEIEKLLNEGDGPLDWEADVKPWLGERAGVFVTGFNGEDADAAVVVASTDDEKAAAAVEKDAGEDAEQRTYEDVEYWVDADGNAEGVVGDFVVVGTERAFRTVVDTVNGDDVETIEDGDQYGEALDAVGGDEDALATVYVNTEGLIDAVGRSGGIPAEQLDSLRETLQENGGEAAAAKLGVADNQVTVESAAIGVTGDAASAGGDAAAAVAALPGDAWMAFGIGAIGERVRNAMDQLRTAAEAQGQDLDQILAQVSQQTGIDIDQDLLSWMGDGGVFVRGTGLSDIGGALVVQTSDPKRSNEAIVKIAQLLQQQSPGTSVSPLRGVAGADDGVVISAPGSPVQVILATAGDRFVAGVGQSAVEEAIDPKTTLADSDAFQAAADALGDDVKPSFFFDVAPVLTLAEAVGAGGDPSFAEAKQYLSQFGSVAAGGSRDGDTQRAKLVITLK